MAVGAEAILVCVWRVLHFSMKTTSLCVQKHPFVSAILFFIYFLYVFFNLFVFWFPFLVCIAALLRVFWTSGGLTILEVKRDEKRINDRIPCKKSESVQDDVAVNRDGCSVLTKQKSRRTNVARRCREEGDAQAGKVEKDAPISTTWKDNLISGTALVGKNTKAVMEEKENKTSCHGESSTAKAPSTDNIQLLVEQHQSVLDSDLSDSNLSSSDDSDGQTEKSEGGGIDGGIAQEDGNKAVQWTDDDQKNLMDLGFSEIERNKRLESLIARRRARKLFKIQVEKGLIDLDTIIPGQIAPIFIAKNNPFEFVEGCNEMDTPGSAPSILLPMQNPFDLPYDPLEEKPNLMADSFQQEFTAVQPKDVLFCRHESFSLGASSFPLETRKKAMDVKGFSRFKKQSETGSHDKHIERMLSGKHDDVIEALLSKVRDRSEIDSNPDIAENGIESSSVQATSSVKPKDGGSGESQSAIDIKGEMNIENISEGQMEQQITDGSNDDESSSTSYSEEDDHTFNASTSGPPPQNALSKVRHVPPKPLTCSVPKSKTVKEALYESSPSANERSRFEERLFYAERGTCHTPTYSIASDLQVEVSELGSPPLTIDGANSPTDRESLNLDGDFEREYMWAASSQSSRTEENESKSRGVRGLSEKDLADIRSSGNNKNTKGVAESSMPLQQPEELDDACSLSSSMTEIYGDSQVHSVNSDGKIHDDVRQVVEEVGNPRTSSSLNALSPENKEETMKLTDTLVSHPSVNPEESSNPPGETTKKVNVPAANTIDNSKDEKKNTDRDGGAQISTKKESVRGLSKPNEGTISESNRHLEKSSVNPAECQATLDSTQPTKDNENSNHSEGGLRKVTENEGKKELDAKKDLNPVQGNKDEQGTAQRGVSEVKQISGDPIASAPQKNLVSKDVPVNSTSSSSPTSVLLEHIPKDQMSSSISNPEGASKSEVGDKVKSNSSEEKPHDSTLLAPQNVMHSVEKPTNQQSNTSDSKTSQEPGKPPEKSTEEINIILNKQAEDIGNLSQKATEAASVLKKQADEIEKVSRKATEAAAELQKPAEETGNMSQKATEATLDMKKSAEEICSASQKANEVVSEIKVPAEGIINVSQKATEAAAELRKTSEEIANVSQKATTVELKKPAEESVSGSNKATEAAAQFKKPAEEIEDVSQKARESDAELKKPAEAIVNVSHKATDPTVELKQSAEGVGSVSQRETEAAAQLKKPAEENENVSQKASKFDAELNKPAEEIRNASEKQTGDATEFKKPAEEIGNASQKATYSTSDLKNPAEQIGNVLQNTREAASELKKVSDEIGSVSTKETVATAELKKPAEEVGSLSRKATEAPAELKRPPEEIGNVSQNANEAPVQLKNPSEEIGSVPQRARDAPAEVKKPAEEIGNVSQKASQTAAESLKQGEKTKNLSGKAIEATAELKKPTEEMGNVSQKVREGPAELEKPIEKIGSASEKATEAHAELKKASEEIESGSQKATEPAGESKKPAENIENVWGKTTEATAGLEKPEVGSSSEKTTDTAAELKKPIEEIGNVSQKATEAPIELKKPSEEIGSVSPKVTETPAELKRPAEEIGKVSEKAIEAGAGLKKTDEKVENLLEKATKTAAELKNPTAEIGSVSQKATKVSADEKSGSISQKATEASPELEKTTEAAVELKKPVEEIKI
ncbi:PREDICTED: dentin sialophospho [Prunus dulcis]|uniref:PREDICTED: dentin sialophospho n=1 Tax=Prunus dulcis TaxID=3755 RepID=A0A5E4FWT9_PRUDU|nr:microtubule-associated protein futsch-like [Prunus dulcis]VVA32011.1 PREDICTED: dentin sialophospho [Prunus dulcis]